MKYKENNINIPCYNFNNFIYQVNKKEDSLETLFKVS